MNQLQEIAGVHTSSEFIKHILKHCDHDINRAALTLLDWKEQEVLGEKEKEWRDEKRERLRFAENYGVASKNVHDVYKPKPLEKNEKVRYLDGTVVSTKGERFVEIKRRARNGMEEAGGR